MEGYQLISYFLTNSIRVLVGLTLVVQVLKIQSDIKKTMSFSIAIAAVITVAQGLLELQQYQLLGGEIILSAVLLTYAHRDKTRMCLFLLFFYELAVVLWEFLCSAGLAALYKNADFLMPGTVEYLAAVWVMRVLMFVMVAVLYKLKERGTGLLRLTTVPAIITFFVMITVAEQTRMPIDEEVTSNWMMMTVILMFAILIFNMSRQYEIEKEVARLQTEQAELIKNDYQKLNQIYTANAKLYHDLHNHMEMMHCYLTQDKVKEALDYLQDLRAPIQELTQTIWTGDEAIDYLLNSKLSLMQKKHISVKTNIEFPRNTNIRSVTLTTILGNLLDNAIEAAQKCAEGQRFVHLTIRRINNILIIKVENSYEERPVTEAGVIQSSKEDKQRHGWGLKSARTAAESCDGSLETTFQDNVFCAVATLFF